MPFIAGLTLDMDPEAIGAGGGGGGGKLNFCFISFALKIGKNKQTEKITKKKSFEITLLVILFVELLQVV